MSEPGHDIEALLAVWLRAELTPARVVTELPSPLASRVPLVQVQRIGGPVVVPLVLEDPRLDVDCYAATRDAAQTLASHAQNALCGLIGRTLNPSAVDRPSVVVARVDITTGATRRPDHNADIRRYGLTAQLRIRPA